MQEFEECTFKPQTREAPGYIKRIAKSEKQVHLVYSCELLGENAIW